MSCGIRSEIQSLAAHSFGSLTPNAAIGTSLIVHVIKGVIDAESGAITYYNQIIEACDGVAWVTQDMVIDILRDEQSYRRLFEGFLREFETEEVQR